VRLFAERASAAAPGFALNDANAATVARICRRLDGIPHAIELAAAWANVLPETEIERRLDDRFRFLTRGPRTALPRQQTLEALIDWSHDLLAPGERALLRRLSVFAGGFTLETVEAVCAWDDDPLLLPDDVLDALSRLVAKSLVPTGNDATDAPAGRYRLLETIREYAAARLRSDAPAGEEATLRERHRAHFLALAEQAEPHLQGPDQAAWLDRLEAEHDNLRAALTPRDDGSDVPLRLCGALFWFWMVRGHLSEGERWLAEALADDQTASSDDSVRAKANKGAGILNQASGNLDTARTHLLRALAFYRERDARKDIAATLNNLAIVASKQADVATARRYYDEALTLYRQLDEPARIAQVLGNLGGIAMEQGDYDAAYAYLTECLPEHERRGDTFSVANTLQNLSGVVLKQGDPVRALQMVQRSLRLRQEIGEKSLLGATLHHIADIHLMRGDAEAATRLFSAADAACAALGTPLRPAQDYHESLAALRHRLGPDAFEVVWNEGQELTREQAVAEALRPTLDTPPKGDRDENRWAV
jgi:tetratricopeptide (TPR) repeat protein